MGQKQVKSTYPNAVVTSSIESPTTPTMANSKPATGTQSSRSNSFNNVNNLLNPLPQHSQLEHNNNNNNNNKNAHLFVVADASADTILNETAVNKRISDIVKFPANPTTGVVGLPNSHISVYGQREVLSIKNLVAIIECDRSVQATAATIAVQQLGRHFPLRLGNSNCYIQSTDDKFPLRSNAYTCKSPSTNAAAAILSNGITTKFPISQRTSLKFPAKTPAYDETHFEDNGETHTQLEYRVCQCPAADSSALLISPQANESRLQQPKHFPFKRTVCAKFQHFPVEPCQMEFFEQLANSATTASMCHTWKAYAHIHAKQLKKNSIGHVLARSMTQQPNNTTTKYGRELKIQVHCEQVQPHSHPQPQPENCERMSAGEQSQQPSSNGCVTEQSVSKQKQQQQQQHQSSTSQHYNDAILTEHITTHTVITNTEGPESRNQADASRNCALFGENMKDGQQQVPAPAADCSTIKTPASVSKQNNNNNNNNNMNNHYDNLVHQQSANALSHAHTQHTISNASSSDLSHQSHPGERSDVSDTSSQAVVVVDSIIAGGVSGVDGISVLPETFTFTRSLPTAAAAATAAATFWPLPTLELLPNYRAIDFKTFEREIDESIDEREGLDDWPETGISVCVPSVETEMTITKVRDCKEEEEEAEEVDYQPSASASSSPSISSDNRAIIDDSFNKIMKYEMKSAKGSLPLSTVRTPLKREPSVRSVPSAPIVSSVSGTSGVTSVPGVSRTSSMTTVPNLRNRSAAGYGSSVTPSVAPQRYSSILSEFPRSESHEVSRSVSMNAIQSVLPVARTSFRRQKRTQSVDPDEPDDPIERLNRLRARISGALSEVKGVLKQYSTETDENAPQPTQVPPTYTAKQMEEPKQPNSDGPVQFRFVRKVRRRSIFNEEDEDKEKEKEKQNANAQKQENSYKPEVEPKGSEDAMQAKVEVLPTIKEMVPLNGGKYNKGNDESKILHENQVSKVLELATQHDAQETTTKQQNKEINDQETTRQQEKEIEIKSPPRRSSISGRNEKDVEQSDNKTQQKLPIGIATDKMLVAGEKSIETIVSQKSTSSAVPDIKPNITAMQMPQIEVNATNELQTAKIIAPELSKMAGSSATVDDGQLKQNEALAQKAPGSVPAEKEINKAELIAKPKRRLSVKATKTTAGVRRASIAAVESSKIEPPVNTKLPLDIKTQRRPSDSEAVIKKKPPLSAAVVGKNETLTRKVNAITKGKRPSLKGNAGSIAINVAKEIKIKTATTEMAAAATAKGAAAPTAKGVETSAVPNNSNKGAASMPQTEPIPRELASPATIAALSTQSVINEVSLTIPKETASAVGVTTKSAVAAAKNEATKDSRTATKLDDQSDAMVATLASPLQASEQYSQSAAKLVSASKDSKETLKPTTSTTLKTCEIEETQNRKASSASKVVSEQQPQISKLVNDQTPSEKCILPHATTLEAAASASARKQEVEKSTFQDTTPTETIIDQKPAAAAACQQVPHQRITPTAAVAIALAASGAAEESLQATANRAAAIASGAASTVAVNQDTTKANNAPSDSISAAPTTASATSGATHVARTTEQTAQTAQTAQTEQTAQTIEVNMPERQVCLAPVKAVQVNAQQEASPPFDVPKEDFPKSKVIFKKIIRKNSIDKSTATKQSKTKAKKDTTVQPVETKPTSEAKATFEIEAQPDKEKLEVEVPESETEPAPTATATPVPALAPSPTRSPRQIKKKVIIKRQQRKLSLSDIFSKDAGEPIPLSDVETLEKAIAYVTDDEGDNDDDAVNESQSTEPPKPLKTCMRDREYQVGDLVMYAERFRKTQVKWKKARVIERITSISYKLDVEGKEVASHISYIKKYTDRKVNFGGKEYLEIDYEQIAEEEKKARAYSIWNMV